MSKQSLFYSRPVIGVAGLTDPAPVKGDVFLPAKTVFQESLVPLGRKDDSGKIRMELMVDLARAHKAVAEVLTWAVTKKQPKPYEPGSWLNVTDFHNRYTAARERHENAVDINGRFTRDAETGLLDLAHAATDAMFLLEKAIRDYESLNASGPAPASA